VSLHNLAMLAARQGDDDRARGLFERAVEIFESSLGAEHPKTVTSRTELAALPPRQTAADDLVAQRVSTKRVRLDHYAVIKEVAKGRGMICALCSCARSRLAKQSIHSAQLGASTGPAAQEVERSQVGGKRRC
jgi:Tetratricopeptide repeat